MPLNPINPNNVINGLTTVSPSPGVAPPMPMAPRAPKTMGIAGGTPGGQVNPSGGTNRVDAGGPGPRKGNPGRGAKKALETQNSMNEAIKSSSISFPLTKKALLQGVRKTVGDFAEGAGHALLDEVDKQKKTKQTNEHRADPPQQNRLA